MKLWHVKVKLDAADDAAAADIADRIRRSPDYNPAPKAVGDRMEFVFVDWVGDQAGVKVWGNIDAKSSGDAATGFGNMIRAALGTDQAGISNINVQQGRRNA